MQIGRIESSQLNTTITHWVPWGKFAPTMDLFLTCEKRVGPSGEVAHALFLIVAFPELPPQEEFSSNVCCQLLPPLLAVGGPWATWVCEVDIKLFSSAASGVSKPGVSDGV